MDSSVNTSLRSLSDEDDMPVLTYDGVIPVTPAVPPIILKTARIVLHRLTDAELRHYGVLPEPTKPDKKHNLEKKKSDERRIEAEKGTTRTKEPSISVRKADRSKKSSDNAKHKEVPDEGQSLSKDIRESSALKDKVHEEDKTHQSEKKTLVAASSSHVISFVCMSFPFKSVFKCFFFFYY